MFHCIYVYIPVIVQARITCGNSIRPSVRPSICPSRAGTVPRPMKIGSCGLYLTAVVAVVVNSYTALLKGLQCDMRLVILEDMLVFSAFLKLPQLRDGSGRLCQAVRFSTTIRYRHSRFVTYLFYRWSSLGHFNPLHRSSLFFSNPSIGCSRAPYGRLIQHDSTLIASRC